MSEKSGVGTELVARRRKDEVKKNKKTWRTAQNVDCGRRQQEILQKAEQGREKKE
ncbi:hypothetical protein RUM43_009413, partial [Polyplax serrata]